MTLQKSVWPREYVCMYVITSLQEKASLSCLAPPGQRRYTQSHRRPSTACPTRTRAERILALHPTRRPASFSPPRRRHASPPPPAAAAAAVVCAAPAKGRKGGREGGGGGKGNFSRGCVRGQHFTALAFTPRHAVRPSRSSAPIGYLRMAAPFARYASFHGARSPLVACFVRLLLSVLLWTRCPVRGTMQLVRTRLRYSGCCSCCSSCRCSCCCCPCATIGTLPLACSLLLHAVFIPAPPITSTLLQRLLLGLLPSLLLPPLLLLPLLLLLAPPLFYALMLLLRSPVRLGRCLRLRCRVCIYDRCCRLLCFGFDFRARIARRSVVRAAAARACILLTCSAASTLALLSVRRPILSPWHQYLVSCFYRHLRRLLKEPFKRNDPFLPAG